MGDFTFISYNQEKKRFSPALYFIYYCIKKAFYLRSKKVGFDLVVSYDPLKTGMTALILAKFFKAKFISEVNGVYTSPEEWLDEPKTLSTAIKKKFYPKLMKFILTKTDGIKLLFDEQIVYIKDELKNKIVHSFPNFVDVDSFRNTADEKIVLLVGFPFKRKGIDVMIKAFKKITEKHPEWQLKILGYFPDKSEINAEINNHPQITHCDPVEYNEMPQEIGSCGILVLPSRSEAMGRVLVEAMAAGKARIGSNVDGIPTVINDGVDGLLVKPGDIDDLASKLDLLITNNDFRKQLALNAEKRAETDFTIMHYYHKTDLFYNEVIG